jgi:hypothetical protein
MSENREFDAQLAAYLEGGPIELATDSYVAVDERVRRTRQRTTVGPWRNPPMSVIPRAAVAAAAVVIAAVGFILLMPAQPGSGGLGSPSPSGSSSAGADVEPSASPSSGPPVYRWPSRLVAGTYSTSFAWGEGLVFRFTVPSGWDALDINIAKADRVSLAFYPINDVAAPTCASPAPSRPAVWTTNTVIAALGRLVPLDAAPVDAAVGDRAARYVEFRAEPPLGCPSNGNVVFRTPVPTCVPSVCGSVGPPTFGLEFGSVVHHERLWLIDVGRQVVAMNALWTDEATPAELAELQAIIDSVRLDTPLATQPPVPQSSGGG